MKQKLILITGTPSIGKTTTTEKLFKLFDNSAFFDGDWGWHVNPFSLDDPRLRDGDKNISFVLNTYLESRFDFIFCSSVLFMFEEVRNGILGGIKKADFETIGFHLICSESDLEKRHYGQGERTEPAYDWLNMKAIGGDCIIDTTNKDIEKVSEQIKVEITNRHAETHIQKGFEYER